MLQLLSSDNPLSEDARSNLDIMPMQGTAWQLFSKQDLREHLVSVDIEDLVVKMEGSSITISGGDRLGQLLLASAATSGPEFIEKTPDVSEYFRPPQNSRDPSSSQGKKLFQAEFRIEPSSLRIVFYSKYRNGVDLRKIVFHSRYRNKASLRNRAQLTFAKALDLRKYLKDCRAQLALARIHDLSKRLKNCDIQDPTGSPVVKAPQDVSKLPHSVSRAQTPLPAKALLSPVAHTRPEADLEQLPSIVKRLVNLRDRDTTKPAQKTTCQAALDKITEFTDGSIDFGSLQLFFKSFINSKFCDTKIGFLSIGEIGTLTNDLNQLFVFSSQQVGSEAGLSSQGHSLPH